MARFCIECGNPLEDGARFCNKCGTPVYTGAETQALEPDESALPFMPEEVKAPKVVEPDLTESVPDEPAAVEETQILSSGESAVTEETQVLTSDEPTQVVANQDDEAERAVEVTEALDSLNPQQAAGEPIQTVAEPVQPAQAVEAPVQPVVEQTQQMPVAAQPQSNAAGYCRVCGAPLELGSAFCQKCGAPAGAPATNANQYAYGAAQTAYNTQESEDDHLIPTWLLGVLAAVAVIAVVLVVINPFNIGKSSDTNETQTEAASTEAASTEAASTEAVSTAAASTEAASTAAASTSAANNYVNGIGNESTEYILPESNTRVYSTSELSVLTTAQLELARNEIYARYGREFKTDYISAHFKAKSWYSVKYSAEAFDAIQESVFNSYEKENIANIKAVEATR